jgi:hypothetical protein
MNDYRGNQCPGRDAGLSHVTGYANVCLYCKQQVTVEPPSGVPPTATQAPYLEKSKVATPYAEQPHDDDTTVEPRMITGNGPQGRAHGKGRGPFTARDKARAIAHVEFGKWLSEHGGGEQP